MNSRLLGAVCVGMLMFTSTSANTLTIPNILYGSVRDGGSQSPPSVPRH